MDLVTVLITVAAVAIVAYPIITLLTFLKRLVSPLLSKKKTRKDERKEAKSSETVTVKSSSGERVVPNKPLKQMTPFKGEINGMSMSGDVVAVFSTEDSEIRILDLGRKEEKNPKIKTEFSFPVQITIDLVKKNEGILVAAYKDGNMETFSFKLESTGEGGSSQSPGEYESINFEHKAFPKDPISLSLSAKHKLVMESSDDPIFRLGSIKGGKWREVKVYNVKTNRTVLSPLGDYALCGGYIPEIKMWHVTYDDRGSFLDLERAAVIPGSSGETTDISFCKRIPQFPEEEPLYVAFAFGKHGTALYDVNIKKRQGEELSAKRKANFPTVFAEKVAINTEATLIAASNGREIEFCSVDKEKSIGRLVSSEIVDTMSWWGSQFLITTGGRRLKIWHAINYCQ